MKEIVIGAGCFWGVQEYYRRLKGIESCRVGYAQGSLNDPTYEEVCSGRSGHSESCFITYNENEITLNQILDHMFRIIDPTSYHKQGNDIGSQYRSGIYYIDSIDREVITKFIADRQKTMVNKIVVECEELQKFYDAESYHQDYLIKNPSGYCHVNFNVIKEEEKK